MLDYQLVALTGSLPLNIHRRKAASQRGAKGLRAFAQSRSNVGLGVIWHPARVWGSGES
jgi:hypothetical protein